MHALLLTANITAAALHCSAVALYKGQLEDAERYLKQAITESSMVEPRILLSQLYWKHKPYDIVEGEQGVIMMTWHAGAMGWTLSG